MVASPKIVRTMQSSCKNWVTNLSVNMTKRVVHDCCLPWPYQLALNISRKVTMWQSWTNISTGSICCHTTTIQPMSHLWITMRRYIRSKKIANTIMIMSWILWVFFVCLNCDEMSSHLGDSMWFITIFLILITECYDRLLSESRSRPWEACPWHSDLWSILYTLQPRIEWTWRTRRWSRRARWCNTWKGLSRLLWNLSESERQGTRLDGCAAKSRCDWTLRLQWQPMGRIRWWIDRAEEIRVRCAKPTRWHHVLEYRQWRFPWVLNSIESICKEEKNCERNNKNSIKIFPTLGTIPQVDCATTSHTH